MSSEHRRRGSFPPIFLFPANDNANPRESRDKISTMDIVFLVLFVVAVMVSFLRY